MSEDDDSKWLAALAGRTGPDDSAAAREADALRVSVLARTVLDDPSVRLRDPAREAQLIERAMRAGLVPRRRTSAWSGFWTPLRGALAVAALACFALTLGLWLRPAGPPEVVRSADGIVRLEAPDPLLRQRQIVDELRVAGVQATAYERLGRAGIDADLPLPIPVDVRAVLERNAIPLPEDGVLRVEIAAPVPQ